MICPFCHKEIKEEGKVSGFPYHICDKVPDPLILYFLDKGLLTMIGQKEQCN